MKKKYTVLLLRPDTIAEQYGEDTYLDWVEEETVEAAQLAAQLSAVQADENECEPEDYLVLAVFDGHLVDHKED